MDWWHIPALVTLAVLAAMVWPSRRAYNILSGVVSLVLGLFGVIVVLSVWLIAALMR